MLLAPESRLIPDNSLKLLPSKYLDGHGLAGVVVGAKFIVYLIDEGIDTGDGLKLDLSQDWALECFGKGLFDLLGASLLGGS